MGNLEATCKRVQGDFCRVKEVQLVGTSQYSHLILFSRVSASARECLALFRQEGGSMQSLITAGNRQRTKSGWTNLGASRSAQYSPSIRPNLAPYLARVLSSK